MSSAARIFRPSTLLTSAGLGGLLFATLVVSGAPPEDINPTKTIVGRLEEIGEGFLVVRTTVPDEEGVGTESDVRVPFRAETTFELDGKSLAWRELQPGDAVKIVPFDDAPGVAQRVSAARTRLPGDRETDAEDEALENRAEQARERLVERRERGLRAASGERALIQGGVFVIELPPESAAARAGFRPGDVVIFTQPGLRDPEVLQGLTVRGTNLRSRFIIDGRAPVVTPETGRVPVRDLDTESDVDVDIDVKPGSDRERIDADKPSVRIDLEDDDR